LEFFRYNGEEVISDRTIKKPGLKNPVSEIDFPAGILFECEDNLTQVFTKEDLESEHFKQQIGDYLQWAEEV